MYKRQPLVGPDEYTHLAAAYELASRLGGEAPADESGCLLVRGAAFPQGLPPLQMESDFWLVPLLAQYNGYASATFETAAQCAARADVLDAALAAQRGVGPVFRLMGRTVKNALRKRKESAR